MFAIIGGEIATIAAAESDSPAKAVARTTKLLAVRVGDLLHHLGAADRDGGKISELKIYALGETPTSLPNLETLK